MTLIRRILLLVFISLFIVSVSNYLVADYQQEKLNTVSEQILAQTVIQSVRDALVQEVYNGNKLRVTNLLVNIKSHDNPIEFLFVTDDYNQIFAHSFDRVFPRYLVLTLNKSINKSGTNLHSKFQTKNGLIYVYSDALIKGLDSALYIGINQTSFNQRLASNQQIIILFSIGFTLVAMLIVFLWGREITKPLGSFTAQIQRFAKGETVDFSKISRSDPDINVLAESFQKATDEQHKARTELQSREQNLSITLNSIGDAVIVTDVNGNISKMNPVAENLTGWTLTEAQGKKLTTVFHLVHGESREPMRNPVEAVFSSGKIVTLPTPALLISRDNTEYQIADSGAPIIDENDTIIGVILVFSDITQENRTEEALRRSQKMEAIGKISGGIAHDFNNQLGIILGYLEFLEEYVKSEEEPSHWVTVANRATIRCMDLTRQLLAFARREVKKTSTVFLNSLITDMSTMIERSVTPEVDVQYYLAENLWSTNIVPGELSDTILNLVINARDAMPEGGRLLIETSNQILDRDYAELNPDAKPGEYVQIVVSDSGIGMNKETQERIFEPFYTTKKIGKGTGLGMSMVYGFIKNYNGYMKIYSELGVGTTMRLYLPRSLDTENVHEPIVTEVIDIPRGSEYVLIVDDEVDLLHLANNYLVNLGYQTVTAENAKEALTILEQESKIDLLFSDIVMPGGMNGYELADQAESLYPNLKILLTSGFTSKNEIKKRSSKYTEHLLSKPYRKIELAVQIRTILDKTLTTDITKPPLSLNGLSIMVIDDEQDVLDLYIINLQDFGCNTIAANNSEQALTKFQAAMDNKETIAAVIIDLNLGADLNGHEVVKKLKEINSNVKIIVSSGNSEGEEMKNYREFNFDGALEKNFNRKNIEKVLLQVINAAVNCQ